MSPKTTVLKKKPARRSPGLRHANQIARRERTTAQTEPSSHAEVRIPYEVSIGIVLTTLLVYARVITSPFINYDDPEYVTQNPHLRAGLSWYTFRWAFTALDSSNWHPLTWLSHLLDYQLFGLHPWGHHLTSILLHGINAVLLFWVLWRATGAVKRSGMVAALFALHPLNVESVAWIAERKNLLCTLFFLLSLAAYLSYCT